MTKRVENVDDHVFKIVGDNYNYSESPSNYLRTRNRTTSRQLAILENVAQETLKPNKNTRIKLGEELGMTARQVQIWFQNKRAKLKKLNYKESKKSSHSKMISDDKIRLNHLYSEQSYRGMNTHELFKSSNNFIKDPYKEYTVNNLYNTDLYPPYFDTSVADNESHLWQQNPYYNYRHIEYANPEYFCNNNFNQFDYQNFFSYNPYQHYSGPEIVPNNFDPLNNEYESTYNDIPENEYNKASNLMFNIKKESVEKEFKQHLKKTK